MNTNYKTHFIIWSLLLSANIAIAQPINYQGRLKEKSGTNVNGTKNFTLRIFDAKTGGKQIYEENVGAVTVNEGAYSFNFGESGKSVVTPTETIALADGEKQIFNYTVKNPPVLGEIKISGGGYSWTEAGSSHATKFTATANKNSGAVSAIFLTGAPEVGENVSISYDHNSNGVMGALSRGGQAWLEITVGGETLSPRERLVAVPFALRAGVADSIASGNSSILTHLFSYSINNLVQLNRYADVYLWRTAIPYDNKFLPFVSNFSSGYISELEKQHPKRFRLHVPAGSKFLKIYIRCSMNGPISSSSVGNLSNVQTNVSMDQHKVKIKLKIGENEKVVELKSKGNFAEGELTISNPEIGFQKLSLLGRMNLVGSKRYQVRIEDFVLYASH